MRRLLVTASCLFFALAGPAAAQEFVPGELIVRFEAGADQGERAEALATRRAAARDTLGARGLTLVRLQGGDSVRAAAGALTRHPDVIHAQPNYVYRTHATPNDPKYPQLWGLSAIKAAQAWDTVTGGAVTVAVVDSGVDVAHPDLTDNIWTNPGETANGLDDDGNGKVDDVNGWDFVAEDKTPEDNVGHGTHVAGTIGARGNNNVGVTGVSWQVKLMALKAGNTGLYSWDIVEAFTYACAKNARVVNGSFGGPTYDQDVYDAIAACPGTLFVFAAGNDGTDNDQEPAYPCGYELSHVICVAATDPFDGLAWFSNYGRHAVDLGAPGEEIESTLPGAAYGIYDGTSMAAPHVAGAAALVAAHRPALTAIQLRAALLNSVDSVPALTNLVGQSGRLNVNAALTASTTPPPEPPPLPPPPPPPPPPRPPADTTAPTDPALASTSHIVSVRSTDATVDVTWSGAFDFGSGIDGFSFHWDSAATTAPDTVKDAEETVGQTTSAALGPGTYWFHLRTRDNAGNWTAGTHLGPFVIDRAAVAQPKRCIVPRLRGKTPRAAAVVLKRAGCRLGPIRRVRSRLKRGLIVSQRPTAGRAVGTGTPVVVFVSRGRR